MVSALGQHNRGRGLGRIIAERHGNVGRVGNHHIGPGHVGQHALAHDFHHLFALLAFDRRVTFGLFLFVLHFRLGHLHAFVVGKACLPHVKNGNGHDGQKGIAGQPKGHVQHVGGHTLGGGIVHGQKVVVFLVDDPTGDKAENKRKK